MEILSTPRLVLRATTEADIAPLHQRIFSDPAVISQVFSGQLLAFDEACEFIRNNFNFTGAPTGLSTLQEKESGEVIGFSGLHACAPLGQDDLELGFVLARSAWGKGYASEIGRAQIAFGFDTLQRPRLLAMADPANVASLRTIERLGLRHVSDVQTADRGMRKVYCIERCSDR